MSEQLKITLLKEIPQFTSDFKSFLKFSADTFIEISKAFPKIEKNINNEIIEAREMIAFFFQERSDNNSYGIAQKINAFRLEIVNIGEKISTMIHEEIIIFNEILQSINEIKNMMDHINALGDISDEIRVFSINSIILANNSGIRGRGYKVLSKELIQFANNITKTGESIYSESENILLTFTNYEKIAKNVQTIEETNRVLLSQKIPNSFQEMERGFTNSSALIHDLINRVNATKEIISNIMINLQNQDIIQQQLEHIIDSFNRLKSKAEPHFNNQNSLDIDGLSITQLQELGDLFEFTKTICKLNTNQLTRIINEIRDFNTLTTNHLFDMETKLGDIIEDKESIFKHLASEKSDNSAIDAIFASSNANLANGKKSFKECFQAKKTLVDLSETALHDIERLDHHFKKINEAVKHFSQMRLLLEIETRRENLIATSDKAQNSKADNIASIISKQLNELSENYFSANAGMRNHSHRYKEYFEKQIPLTTEIENKLSNSEVLLADSRKIMKENLFSLIGFTDELKYEVDQAIANIKTLGKVESVLEKHLLTIQEIEKEASENQNKIKLKLKITEWKIAESDLQKLIDEYTVAAELATAQNTLINIDIEQGVASDNFTLF